MADKQSEPQGCVDKEKGQAVADAIGASGGSAVFVAGDLIDAEAALDLASRATEALGGRVDILINSAGAFPFGPTESHDEATFDVVYALNVKAPWFLVATLAPSMAERGSGSIVNVSTMVASFGVDGMALYGSSRPRWSYSPRRGQQSSVLEACG